jgi:hypothetical protein
LLGEDHQNAALEDQDVEQWIILRWNLERQDGEVLIGLFLLRTGTLGVLVKAVLNLRVSQNGGKFLSGSTTGSDSK